MNWHPRVQQDQPIFIDPKMHSFMDHLAPGVIGYTVEDDDGLWVPLIYAENPGAGDVGRFLDSLPKDRTVIVPNVLNPRLAAMLDRRGFTEGPVPVDPEDQLEIGETAIPAYVRRPDREPQPTDGPDYHADHAAWQARQR